jgi:hypothetical protein
VCGPGQTINDLHILVESRLQFLHLTAAQTPQLGASEVTTVDTIEMNSSIGMSKVKFLTQRIALVHILCGLHPDVQLAPIHHIGDVVVQVLDHVHPRKWKLGLHCWHIPPRFSSCPANCRAAKEGAKQGCTKSGILVTGLPAKHRFGS